MNIIQFHYFRFIKFCVIAVTAFSLFACDDIIAALNTLKSHTSTASDDDDPKKSEALDKFKKQNAKWLSEHLFAGNINEKGHKDGQGSDALFSHPLGMAADSSGNIYIADSGNHVIRKVTLEGEVTTWAGVPNTRGFRDGTRKKALFNNPTNLIIKNDIMYILDTDNHKIRKIVGNFVSTTMGGAKGYKNNPDGTEDVQFEYPQGFNSLTWSDKSIKQSDSHKKYGDHTDITIYDGPNAKRQRIIVLKDGAIQSIETVQEKVKFNGLEYRENGMIMILNKTFLILDPTKNALFKL